MITRIDYESPDGRRLALVAKGGVPTQWYVVLWTTQQAPQIVELPTLGTAQARARRWVATGR